MCIALVLASKGESELSWRNRWAELTKIASGGFLVKAYGLNDDPQFTDVPDRTLGGMFFSGACNVVVNEAQRLNGTPGIRLFCRMRVVNSRILTSEGTSVSLEHGVTPVFNQDAVYFVQVPTFYVPRFLQFLRSRVQGASFAAELQGEAGGFLFGWLEEALTTILFPAATLDLNLLLSLKTMPGVRRAVVLSRKF